MKAIKATWKNGRVVPDESVDWPDGCRLLIEPVIEEKTLGIREADWPTDAEGIAELLARMEQIKPLELTEQEEAELEAARRARKHYEKANFKRRAKMSKELFE